MSKKEKNKFAFDSKKLTKADIVQMYKKLFNEFSDLSDRHEDLYEHHGKCVEEMTGMNCEIAFLQGVIAGADVPVKSSNPRNPIKISPDKPKDKARRNKNRRISAEKKIDKWADDMGVELDKGDKSDN